jgi:hypothetical protein
VFRIRSKSRSGATRFKSFLASHLRIHQSKVLIRDPEKTYSEKKYSGSRSQIGSGSQGRVRNTDWWHTNKKIRYLCFDSYLAHHVHVHGPISLIWLPRCSAQVRKLKVSTISNTKIALLRLWDVSRIQCFGSGMFIPEPGSGINIPDSDFCQFRISDLRSSSKNRNKSGR